jgi:hypothetical protein
MVDVVERFAALFFDNERAMHVLVVVEDGLERLYGVAVAAWPPAITSTSSFFAGPPADFSAAGACGVASKQTEVASTNNFDQDLFTIVLL